MSTISRLRQMLALGAQADSVSECRLCGTSVDSEAKICPECGSEEIARYEF